MKFTLHWAQKEEPNLSARIMNIRIFDANDRHKNSLLDFFSKSFEIKPDSIVIVYIPQSFV